jgi:hypothetical protein
MDRVEWSCVSSPLSAPSGECNITRVSSTPAAPRLTDGGADPRVRWCSAVKPGQALCSCATLPKDAGPVYVAWCVTPFDALHADLVRLGAPALARRARRGARRGPPCTHRQPSRRALRRPGAALPGAVDPRAHAPASRRPERRGGRACRTHRDAPHRRGWRSPDSTYNRRPVAMELLPPAGVRPTLLDALALIIRRQGYETFVHAPIVEPTTRYFPDPWEASERGVRALSLRLLAYARRPFRRCARARCRSSRRRRRSRGRCRRRPWLRARPELRRRQERCPGRGASRRPSRRSARARPRAPRRRRRTRAHLPWARTAPGTSWRSRGSRP